MEAITAQLMRTNKGAEIEYAIPFAGAGSGTSIVTGAAAEPPFDDAGAGVEGWLFAGGSIAGDGGDSVAGAGSGTEDGEFSA